MSQEHHIPVEVEDAIGRIEICEECDGSGVRGHNSQGKKIACENCGGHEDQRGRGLVCIGDALDAIGKTLAAARNETRAEVIARVEEILSDEPACPARVIYKLAALKVRKP